MFMIGTNTNSNPYTEYSKHALADRVLFEISSKKIIDDRTGELHWINLEYAEKYLHRFFCINSPSTYKKEKNESVPLQICKSDINNQLRERLESLGFEELNEIMVEVTRRLLESVDCYYYHISGIHGKVKWSFVDFICLN